jgi:predicted RNase H-like HicB family nuclease
LTRFNRRTQNRAQFSESGPSPNLPIPAVQSLLEDAHEFAAVGAVDQAMIEAGCTMISMANYRVVLRKSDEGYSVSCPGLPGCWSQGATEEEALANIQVAIREYAEAAEELSRDAETRVVEVAVA